MCLYLYVHIHAHAHTHIHIYIYIYTLYIIVYIFLHAYICTHDMPSACCACQQVMSHMYTRAPTHMNGSALTHTHNPHTHPTTDTPMYLQGGASMYRTKPIEVDYSRLPLQVCIFIFIFWEGIHACAYDKVLMCRLTTRVFSYKCVCTCIYVSFCMSVLLFVFAHDRWCVCFVCLSVPVHDSKKLFFFLPPPSCRSWSRHHQSSVLMRSLPVERRKMRHTEQKEEEEMWE